jgi:hypothetical protein
MKTVVVDYIAKHRDKAQRELRYFKIQRTLEEAVSLAALAKKPNGKRFSHQRRIPEPVLKRAEAKLLRAVPRLRRAKFFDELHYIIETEILPIFGIGELMVYDTALRVGAKLGLEPTQVFLHAGTRVGARKLGINGGRKSVPISEFPAPLRRLSAKEVEDVLCIYEKLFGRQTLSLMHSVKCG